MMTSNNNATRKSGIFLQGRKMSNAYNNPKKITSRSLISDKINTLFKDRGSINFVELLGEGVGAHHYLKNIDNLSELFLVERLKKNFEYFLLEKYSRFQREFPDVKISPKRVGITKFIKTFPSYSFDVVNLDFCGLFKIDANEYVNNVIPLVHLLSSRSLKDGGLFFVTYKIGGWLPSGWDDQYLLNDSKAIAYYIIKLAEHLNCNVDLVHEYTYSSKDGQVFRGTGSVMLNLGFKLKYLE